MIAVGRDITDLQRAQWGLFLNVALAGIATLAVAIFGVVAGSVATWLRQRRWRHTARQYETDAREARAELADLRSRYESRETSRLPDLTRRTG